MIVAIASGKGGTGKTSLAVALAQSAGEYVQLLDCDVEEPNAHLFFKEEETELEPAVKLVPAIDGGLCTGCGKCREVCRYNAIVVIKSKAMVFRDLCHSCGGCVLSCSEKAIKEIKEKIGTICRITEGNIELVYGELEIGQAMSPPVIRQVKSHAGSDLIVIIDSPPGTSCPMVAAVKGSDYIILVTEPSPFGFHDLKLAVETVKKMKIPFGIVINRYGNGYMEIEKYCEANKIPVLLKINESRKIAEAYSIGESLLSAESEYRMILKNLLVAIAGDRE